MVIENRYENWKDIPWNKIRLEIYNLQYKIFCHAKKNHIGMLRHCQRHLVKSLEAKLLAVRLVTQDNRRKATAGVDGISNVKPAERLHYKQNYLCSNCGLFLLPDEIIELHHVLDENLNRTGEICFVHGHCHDKIHSTNKFNK